RRRLRTVAEPSGVAMKIRPSCHRNDRGMRYGSPSAEAVATHRSTSSAKRFRTWRTRSAVERGGSGVGTTAAAGSAGHEVLGLGVVADERRGALLGLVLEARVLVALETDALALEQ